jgi:hypothetical protein
MIDYDTPDPDPIVAEVRRVREQIFAEFNYDLHAYCEYLRSLEATSGRKYITAPLSESEPQTDSPAKKAS